ncbi:MAG: YggS family pyridoxal phosphate-dependent enzyme [Ardenticatenaceae bacterium]|nr:YggS family pyridoxal phosphate-dependent enzyme [Ardenticatenaceae bacterium]
MTTLIKRHQLIQTRMAQAAERVGRDPAKITLIGVTKTWPLDTLIEAYRAGIRHFGENRTAELSEKRAEFAARLPEAHDVVWHFVGHLQSRQSQSVATFADVFHGADRLKILRRLNNQLQENDRTLSFLLEVNISGEASKGGFPVASWQDDRAQINPLSEAVALAAASDHLHCRGLMTMAPWHAPEEVIRAVFAHTRQLRDHLVEKTGHPLPILSMGMTDDFEIAIEEGATHIRVGRALFGERY